MKKLICILLALSVIAGFSVTAFADIIVPAPFERGQEDREAVVTAPGGAKDVTNPDRIIPNGTTVYVTGYSKDDSGNIIVDVYWQNSREENSYKIAIDDLSGPGVETIKNTEGQNGIIGTLKEKLYDLYMSAVNAYRSLQYRIRWFVTDLYIKIHNN